MVIIIVNKITNTFITSTVIVTGNIASIVTIALVFDLDAYACLSAVLLWGSLCMNNSGAHLLSVAVVPASPSHEVYFYTCTLFRKRYWSSSFGLL